jgi:hypothetical protein
MDRSAKFSRYAGDGIGLCWLVDPGVPSVQMFTFADGAYVLAAEGVAGPAVTVTEPSR